MAEAAIREITDTEGRDYLALGRVGRLAWVNGEGELRLMIINYSLDKDRIYYRTTSDSELATLTEPTAVAFEADHLEEIYQTGWSVTVHGTTAPVSEDEAASLEMPPTPWAPGDRSVYVSISVDKVGGRKVRGAM